MEEKCQVCGTIRIPGMDCEKCGWEFLDLMDEGREQKIKECRDFLASKHESNNFLDKNEVEETQDIPVLDTKDNPAGAEKMLIQDESTDTEEDATIESTKEHPNKVLLDDVETIVNEGVNKILDTFDRKLAHDKAKDKQVDNLHAELQEYKRDLIAKTNRPLVNGLIFMFGDMDKLITKLILNSEELSQEKLFKILQDIKEDLEILLEQNGVVSFTEENTKFNPRKQQVVKKIETFNESLVGKVEKSIRPGFEQGDEVIAKERVAVYVLGSPIEDETENEEPQLNTKDDENEQ